MHSVRISFIQKTFVVGVFIVSLLTPHTSLAATSQQQLLQLIDELMRQVAVLQQMLNEQRAAEAGAAYRYEVRRPATTERYELQFFSVTPETTYKIVSGALMPTHGTQARTIDQTIFSLLRETWGTAAFRDHDIAELWIFNQDRTTLSGFVESRSDTGSWIVGINRADFDITSPDDRAAYQELFRHEYAHILLLDQIDLQDSFTNRFWRSADYRASAQIQRAYESGSSFSQVDTLYTEYADRFQSAYAMLNPDEDLAETFVAFLEADRPTRPSNVREEKIAFLYQYPFLVTERARLRAQW